MPNQNYQDTPQFDMFGVPIDESDMFGNEDPWNQNEMAPEVPGQPNPLSENGQGSAPQNNEEVRYQYWQSQYDQLKNQYSKLEQQNQTLMQEFGGIKEALTATPEPEEERFPDAPAAPKKPYGYSPMEAMSDPSSESAKYQIQLAEHNAYMNQYVLAKSDWLDAKQRKAINDLSKQRDERDNESARSAQVSAQINQAVAMVQKQYGVDYDTAIDFVNTMSDNSSITMDNLFTLYKMQKGGAMQQNPMSSQQMRFPQQQAPQNNFNPFGVQINRAMPSPDFQQRQRAQSVPPTMGVHNAQGNSPQEDPFMTALKTAVLQQNSSNVF